MFKRLIAPFTRLSHRTVSLLLLGGLLFLRLPYLTTLGTLFTSPPVWLFLSFTIATYLLTALLIWWERERLQDFWFDLVSAIVFLCQRYMFPVGVGLFVAMRRSKARFPAPPPKLLRWMLIGGILAILAEIVLVQTNLNPVALKRAAQPATLGFLFTAFLTQLVSAAVWEEPLFRGFLWGHLRLAGWKNAWVWLFQAGLFTLGHVYYLRQEAFLPWLIRMLIPSLLVGLIAWQARSIAASMVTHGFLNAAGDLLMHIGTREGAFQIARTGAGILAAALLAVLLIEFILRRRGKL